MFDGVRCMMEMLRALYAACHSLVACCAAWQGLIRDDSLGMAEVDLARYGTGPADQGTRRRAAVLRRPAPSVLSGSKPLRIRPKRTPARQDRSSPELLSSRVCLSVEIPRDTMDGAMPPTASRRASCALRRGAAVGAGTVLRIDRARSTVGVADGRSAVPNTQVCAHARGVDGHLGVPHDAGPAIHEVRELPRGRVCV